MQTPADVYAARLSAREQCLRTLDDRSAGIGNARLGVAIVFLALAWACVVRRDLAPVWMLVPVVVFVALVWYHRKIVAQGAQRRRAVLFYKAGLERSSGSRPSGGALGGGARGGGALGGGALGGGALGGGAPGSGAPAYGAPSDSVPGERFIDEQHLYGADLDLFGKHSLFELLCRARTPMGEATLAEWLLNPAELGTIRQRQTSIAALRDGLDFREDLAVCGEPARIGLNPQALARWADAPAELDARWLRAATYLLTLLAVASALVWAMWGWASAFLAVVVIEASVIHALRERISRVTTGVESANEDLKLLSSLLRRIETEAFEAAPLQALKTKLSSHSHTASATLGSLATIANFVEARRNPFLAPLLVPLLYSLHCALAAERWRRRHGMAMNAWLNVLGEVEALVSLAGYSYERPDDVFPDFITGPGTFRAKGLGHPLISSKSRVCNDVEISFDTRVLLVSGSNMSGKSTLLRAVGMNTVLAMAGAPVCASQLQLTPLQVGASIRVNDSLYEATSRFYAEIKRLRLLFEPSKLPLLFLLDELLQGTNSNDRRIGAHGVIRALLERGGIGLVSTHDLALNDISGLPARSLRNVHFEDELEDGEIKFDFVLRDGVVTKSNGLALMRAIGLEV